MKYRLKDLAKQHLSLYVVQMKGKDWVKSQFHKNLFKVLDDFAEGKIRRLILTMPSQHTKSSSSSMLLPSYLIGKDPDLRIVLASYNATLARSFNKQIQRYIDDSNYPFSGLEYDTKTTDYFSVKGRRGFIKSVGKGGGLTGFSCDVLIIDDLYKNALEANSTLARENTWDWYNSVCRTRLHNESRELITFTRWHMSDLIGELEKRETVVELDRRLEEYDNKTWYKINFEAIKESEKTELDPREKGEALWPVMHNIESLKAKRALDPHAFQTLYQGNPKSRSSVLYSPFTYYISNPEGINKCYIDTADTGKDYLCAIVYTVNDLDLIYIREVLYTRESMEITEDKTRDLLNRWNVQTCYVESNNGGRGFARAVERGVRSQIIPFHQSGNKESRILTNSSTVNRVIRLPKDIDKHFLNHLEGFKSDIKSNTHDDCADCITGIIEKEFGNTMNSVSVW